MTRNIIAASFVFACSAWAGDKYIGTISSSGASANNKTPASTDAGFVIPPNQKLSVQCSSDAYLTTDTGGAITTTNGAYVFAGSLFQTSTGGQFSTTLDGGANSPATNQLNILSVDAGAVSCKVFTRLGTE